jgi:hypothetical protein
MELEDVEFVRLRNAPIGVRSIGFKLDLTHDLSGDDVTHVLLSIEDVRRISELYCSIPAPFLLG